MFFPFCEKYVKTVQPLAWGYMPGCCVRYGLLKNSFGFHLWQHVQIWRNQWLSSNRLHLLGNFDLPQQLFMSVCFWVFVGPLQYLVRKKPQIPTTTMHASPPTHWWWPWPKSGWASDGRISFSEWLGTWLLVRYCWWFQVEIPTFWMSWKITTFGMSFA